VRGEKTTEDKLGKRKGLSQVGHGEKYVEILVAFTEEGFWWGFFVVMECSWLCVGAAPRLLHVSRARES
jgi:hypothetical protein